MSTVPDGFGTEQAFNHHFVIALHHVADAARVIVIELRRRAHGRAHATVHAGVESLLIAQILLDQFEQIPHISQISHG